MSVLASDMLQRELNSWFPDRFHGRFIALKLEVKQEYDRFHCQGIGVN
jgi:hypothetical protein